MGGKAYRLFALQPNRNGYLYGAGPIEVTSVVTDDAAPHEVCPGFLGGAV
jgi:hypothetical protein